MSALSRLFGRDLTKTVKKQLECPVCMCTSTPPIFMCTNGHNVCSFCQPQLTKCPVCRCPGRPEIRNRFAEQLAQSGTVPCKNVAKGCMQRVTVKLIESHLKACPFNFECLFEKCPWRGSVVDLADHARNVHRGSFIAVDDDGVLLKLPKELGFISKKLKKPRYTTSMLAFKGNILWYHTEYTEDYFNFQLHLIGVTDVFEFSYELQFLSRRGALISFKKYVRPMYSNVCCDNFCNWRGFPENGFSKSKLYKLKLSAGVLSGVGLFASGLNTYEPQVRGSKPDTWVVTSATSSMAGKTDDLFPTVVIFFFCVLFFIFKCLF